MIKYIKFIIIMEPKLDTKDLSILRLLQENCRLSAKDISKKTGILTTTVYAKIKRMESLGVIKGYNAVLDGKMLGKPVCAFILVSFEYRQVGGAEVISQREIAKKISGFPEVQEVHIITGEWDLLIKIKSKSVEDTGKFVVDKLRKVKGIGKAITSMIFETEKESLKIDI